MTRAEANADLRSLPPPECSALASAEPPVDSEIAEGIRALGRSDALDHFAAGRRPCEGCAGTGRIGRPAAADGPGIVDWVCGGCGGEGWVGK